MVRRVQYIIVLFLFHSGSLWSQLENIRFDRISSIYGLPTGGIVEIIEDDFGFLWVATDEGLFRYDGYEFKAFRHDVQDCTYPKKSNPWLS